MSNPNTSRGPIAWMAKNPVAANLLMAITLMGGLAAIVTVKQEVFPSFDLDVVSVTVPYPGASPTEVEQGISLAVEEAVRGVDGVKKVSSNATEGAGNVSVELLVGADPEKALQDVKNEVDRIRTFPEEAEDPQVALGSRRNKVVSLVIAGDHQLSTLHGLAEQVRAELLASGEVTQADIEGVPPLELSIEFDPMTLKGLGLTLDQVAQQLKLNSIELPGGGVDTKAGELLVRVADRKRTVAEFADVIIHSSSSGAEVRLGDVATIRDGFEESDQATYFDGKPAVLITAYRVGEETPTSVSKAVHEQAQKSNDEFPEGVELVVWDDDSELLRDRIDLLVRNARSGIVLVLIVLALFLNLRLAFWVGLGIPISFMGAFFLFPTLGVTINMISLFALIVTLGLVVDDAIVVGENVYEKTEAGKPPMQAAIEGAQEMVVPVTFAILTTFAAFAPMFFVPGTSGKIFGVIPYTVLAVLTFSLLESFLILPAHLGHASKGPWIVRKLSEIADVPRKFVDGYLKRFIAHGFTSALKGVLRGRYAAFAFAGALFAWALGAVVSGALPFSFMPKTEADLIRASARLPYGVPIEETNRVRGELERALEVALTEAKAHDAIRGVLASVGQGAPQFGPAAGARAVGSHLLSIEVDLVPLDQRNIATSELSAIWQKHVPDIPGVESLTFVDNIGPSGGAAVDVQISHLDTEKLAAASEEVTQALRGYADLANISNGYAAGKPQLDFHLLPAARTLGVTASDVARQMRSAFYGAEAIREQRGRNELKVMVRLNKSQRVSEKHIEQLEIRTPSGAYVPLATVATFERTQAPTSITRKSGRRVVDVTAELAPGVATTRPVLEHLEAKVLPEIRARYSGLDTRFAGEQESQNESLESLGRNFLFALLVMYALLAVPFKSYVQPLIIMSVIPFGFVGAVGGHLLMGYGLSIISVMGIIALAGVVVNDSLVLIDAANRFRQQGMTPFDAIVAGATRRFRPILLTSLTTFFGLLPMIFEPSTQARFLIPMAISLGFGVLFTTFVVLLLVPALYLMIEDLINLTHKLFGTERQPSQHATMPASSK